MNENDKPGKLDALKLKKDYDINPGPVYGKIKSGEVIKLDDGKQINPEDYLSPSLPGRKLAIFGDTYDSYHMALICKGSDLLVHEATLENALYSKAIEYGHSTPEMAAKFASFVNAKKLCLSHLSPRYKPQSNENAHTNKESDNRSRAVTASILKNEAEQYLNSIDSKIEVILAEDFLVVPVLKL
jgi:ribonuclease Z